MTQAKAGQQAEPNAMAWSTISKQWGAAGGESLAALNASLHATSKKNPLGLLDANDPVRKTH